MKQKNRWMVVMGVLMLTVLACAPCGLGNFLERTSAGAIEEVEKAVESAAQEAAETIEEAAENQDLAPTEEEESQEAAQPAEESSASTKEAAQGSEEATTADSGQVEALNLPSNPQDSLANFDSYALEYLIETQSNEETMKITMLIEKTENTQHIVMQGEGSAAQLGDFDRFEMFVVAGDGETTMYMQNPQDQSWMAITASDLDEAFGMLPISPNSFGAYPQQGQLVEEVELNGVQTKHYVFSENDFLGTAPGIERANGDIWVNEEMGLVMKAIISVEGAGLSLGSQAAEVASYNVTCEVKKLNDPSIVITVPEAALNSDAISIPGTSTDADQIDFPTPPGANVEMAMTGMLNLTVEKSVQEVWQFYQQNLGSDNWQISIETPTNIMATYNGGETPVQVMIVEEGSGSRVIVSDQ